eukprot:scaffold27616_cov64-Phaeocystis_antarctica.AAC.10
MTPRCSLIPSASVTTPSGAALWAVTLISCDPAAPTSLAQLMLPLALAAPAVAAASLALATSSKLMNCDVTPRAAGALNPTPLNATNSIAAWPRLARLARGKCGARFRALWSRAGPEVWTHGGLNERRDSAKRTRQGADRAW